VEEIFTGRSRIPDEGDFINMMFCATDVICWPAITAIAGGFQYCGPDKVAYDVREHVPLPINNDLKQLAVGGFAFVGADTIVGRHYENGKKSGSYSFPAGAPIEQFEVPRPHFVTVSKGNYVLIDGGGPYYGSVLDLQTKKYMRPGQQRLRDVFGNIGATETPNGELALYDLKDSSAAPDVLPIAENSGPNRPRQPLR
jgi:hypothetical protein